MNKHIKNTFTLITLSVALFFSTQQQAAAQTKVELPEGLELGLRIGETQGSALAFDAVFPFRGNRLRADIGFLDRFSVSALHDWKFIINENLFWYPGAGAVVDFEDGVDIGAVGEIGIEYLIQSTPISIALDWRPTLNITAGGFDETGFSINVRYRF